MPDNLEQQQGQQPSGQPAGEPKIFGKYTDMTEAEKGYFSAVEEMNKAKQQLGMAVDFIEKMKAQGQPQPQAPVKPDYETQLEAYGVPSSAIKAMVQAVSREVANEVVSSQLTPLASGASARQNMASKYQDYPVNEGAIMSYVKSQPELAQRFEELLAQNRPLDALEIGYFHWKANKPVQPVPDPTKTAAGMPGGAGAGARAPQGMQVGREERLAKAVEYFGETRDFMPLFNEKLGDVPLTWTEQMEQLGRTQR